MRSRQQFKQRFRVKLVEPGGIKSNFINSIQWAEHPAYELESTQMKEMAMRLNDNSGDVTES